MPSRVVAGNGLFQMGSRHREFPRKARELSHCKIACDTEPSIPLGKVPKLLCHVPGRPELGAYEINRHEAHQEALRAHLELSTPLASAHVDALDVLVGLSLGGYHCEPQDREKVQLLSGALGVVGEARERI